MLIEVVIALFVFGAVMLACYSLIIAALRVVNTTREELYVNRVIESTVEEIRHLSWAELTAQPESQTFSTDYPITTLFDKPPNPAAIDNPDYGYALPQATGTITISNYTNPDGVAEDSMRKVTVEIAWVPYGRSSGTRSLKTTTLISENGINRR
jgi:hypothetical protein